MHLVLIYYEFVTVVILHLVFIIKVLNVAIISERLMNVYTGVIIPHFNMYLAWQCHMRLAPGTLPWRTLTFMVS